MRLSKACGPFLLALTLALMKAFATYLKNVRAEMAHVVWPDRKQAVLHTVLIILISALLAIVIAVLDYAFTGVVSRIIG